MKKIILTLCLITSIAFADKEIKYQPLSYSKSLSMLQTIQNDAITYGNGKKSVYVFIDPLCPYSRKFITLVSKNPKMISKYQYHLFLYSVPRLKSTDVVSSIYMSKDPIQTLLKTMVEEKIQYEKGNKITKARVDRIEKIGKEMQVHKRPYIFVIHEG